MEHELVARGYTPKLSKSWMIRVGVLDILNGYDDITDFLEPIFEQLSDDLKALYNASIDWTTGGPVRVGESATLCRDLWFASCKYNLDKKFILEGTLKERDIFAKPEIVNYSLKELLELPGRSSQYASASLICGSKERLENPPYKVKVTEEAISHWNERRQNGQRWEPRHDETILRQAVTFLKLLKYGEAPFEPQHSEDYLFAVVLGYMDAEEGKKRFPSVEGHETNRVKEAKKVLGDYMSGNEIVSKDHRAIQAIAMKAKLEGKEIKIKCPEKVSKSWPEFWKFLNDSPKLLYLI